MPDPLEQPLLVVVVAQTGDVIVQLRADANRDAALGWLEQVADRIRARPDTPVTASSGSEGGGTLASMTEQPADQPARLNDPVLSDSHEDPGPDQIGDEVRRHAAEDDEGPERDALYDGPPDPDLPRAVDGTQDDLTDEADQ